MLRKRDRLGSLNSPSLGIVLAANVDEPRWQISHRTFYRILAQAPFTILLLKNVAKKLHILSSSPAKILVYSPTDSLTHTLAHLLTDSLTQLSKRAAKQAGLLLLCAAIHVTSAVHNFATFRCFPQEGTSGKSPNLMGMRHIPRFFCENP